MLNIFIGAVLAFLISYFSLSVYLGLDTAIASIVAAIASIVAGFVVALASRR